MGSRLHGNDGGRRRTSHGRRRRPHIVIPPKAGIHGHPYRHSREGGNPRRGDTAMGSRLHGNDSGRRRTPHGRRRRTRIVIPATAGIHGGGRRRWVPVYTGTTVAGGAPHTVGGGAPTSSFPRRRESTAGGHCDGFPSTRERRWAAAHPHRHCREGGNPRRGEPAMGSRLHGNDDGRRRTHIVIAAKAGIHGGGSLRWVHVYTGTTVGDGAPHTVGERRWTAARARRAADARWRRTETPQTASNRVLGRSLSGRP